MVHSDLEMFNQNSEQLVTIFGGSGYIGSILTRLFLEQGYRVRVFDSFLFGDDGVKDLRHHSLEVVTGDICNISQVSAATRGANIVILLADLAGRRFVSRHANDAYYRDVNYLAASVVLHAAREYGAERFIYASSDSVYGSGEGLVYETSMPVPISLYARLKLRMEDIVIRAKTREFHPTVLRIATCYGYSQRMRFDLLPNTILRDAIFTGQVHIESEIACRSYIHVADAAKVITMCAKTYLSLVSGEIFNVGVNNQNLTTMELLNVIRMVVSNFSVKVHKGAPDLPNYRLSCRKLEKFLDFEPSWTMKDGLIDLRNHLTSGTIKDPYDKKYRNGNVFSDEESSVKTPEKPTK